MTTAQPPAKGTDLATPSSATAPAAESSMTTPVPKPAPQAATTDQLPNKTSKQDTFETGDDNDDDDNDNVELSRASIDMDDIPIELVSKIDKYAPSLPRPLCWQCW